MNVYGDEALKQEVIYLHSLWHQGPPGRNPKPTRNPISDPIPRPGPNYIQPVNLHQSSGYGPVRFHHGSRNPNHHSRHPYNRPGPDLRVEESGREWPMIETPRSPQTASGWREFKTNLGQKTQPVSADEQSRFAAMKLQRNVIKTCRKFFTGKSAEEEGGGGGDEAEVDHGDEDYLPEKDGSSAVFEFFSRLLEENSELKGFYEKNPGNGEFLCLVCGGTGGKTGRRFKSCLALVQHSLTIHKKTNMKAAHRAFAQVICNILGWDINNPVASSMKDAQVPSVVSNAEQPSWRPLSPARHVEKQGISDEEQATFAALQMQQRASEAYKKFFAGNDGSDDESEEENDDTDESQSEEFKFLLGVFSETDELKSYYEKNYESGDFICLVCAGMGKRAWKRFKDCPGLLQHSYHVQNMKKKWAHRSYARVICEVLSWDFDRLPLIVAKGGDPLMGSDANQNNEASSVINEDHLCENQANKDTQNNGEACPRSCV